MVISFSPVCVSEDVKCVRRQDLERNWIEALWLEVKLRRKQLLVCNIYRPPDAKAEWMESLQEMVEYGIQEKKPTIMMGDFNCDMLRSNSSTVRLTMMMSEYGLTQMVNCPTRVTANSSTQIDLLFTTDVELIERVGCEEPGLSDHDLIYGQLTSKVDRKTHTLRTVKCIGKCNVEELVIAYRACSVLIAARAMAVGSRRRHVAGPSHGNGLYRNRRRHDNRQEIDSPSLKR